MQQFSSYFTLRGKFPGRGRSVVGYATDHDATTVFCGKHAKVSSPFTLYITEAEAAASERENFFLFPDPSFFFFS